MKIFDISFSKTGTTSLAFAMGHLGYKSSHNCPEPYREDFLNKVPYGRFDLNIVEDHDFIGNLLFSYYAALCDLYPDAQFIMLLRDEDQWVASMLAQMKKIEKGLVLDVGAFNRIANMGCISTENRDWLKFRYRQHNQGVVRHFQNKPNLLIMEITEGWVPLCRFLGVRIPDKPFPKLNTSYRPVLL